MYLLLLVGFILLIKGADLFVDGASSIAGLLKIPSIIIGLTIVAMGTSAPEASVSLTAALNGSNSLSLGNIIGSNIFNLLVVIGVSAILHPIASQKDIINRDLWWNLAVTGILFVFLFDMRLSRIEGILLLIGMAIYLFVLIRNALHNRTTSESQKVMSPLKSILYILIGLGAVIWGGNLVVNNASLIAVSLGMSSTLIGLTIVAIGTSLPELVTSITAARKGDPGIALGNAVGSGLFNIMFILGTTAAITPLTAVPELLIDTAILFVVGILLLVFIRTKKETSRLEGLLCVLCYIGYSVYIILR